MPDPIKYYEQGNFDLETAAFTGTPDADGFTYGASTTWHGLMEINLTGNQETTNIAADDFADYLPMVPPLVYTGTVKLTGIPVADYEKLFNVRRGKNYLGTQSASTGALLFGSRAIPKQIGMAFKNTGYDENGVKYTIKTVFYRVTVTLPDIGTESLTEDGTTIRDVSINVRASYVKYKWVDTNTVTHEDTATFGIFDSTTNSAIWDTIKSGIYPPNEISAPVVNATPGEQ